MSYNAKNYTEQGGEKTVIGGTLEIKEGATVTGLPQMEKIADATSTNAHTVLNALLAALIEKGYMSAT